MVKISLIPQFNQIFYYFMIEYDNLNFPNDLTMKMSVRLKKASYVLVRIGTITAVSKKWE
jgi:low temperature requirement protein LtrA